MDQLPALGTEIASTAPPTLRIYAPLLLANRADIKSTPRKTFSYGPHSRQQLDVYYPASSTTNEAAPVLIFLYGGGLVRGCKTLAFPTGPYADGLVHANVGHFFATRFGLTTVVADYRLMSHGAKFPSGGEDLSLVVDWVKANLAAEGGGASERDLFIMGNSAGGIHLATYLYSPVFAKQRETVLGDGPNRSGLRLRGVVMLSVPFHFRAALGHRAETLEAYFGDIEGNGPLGLLKAARSSGEAGKLDRVKVFVLNGTLDPEDEILRPRNDFVEEWERGDDERGTGLLTVEMMQGQNHISPPLGLGTGVAREEAWGVQVGEWIEECRR